MKSIIAAFAVVAAAGLVALPDNAAAQSQGVSVERSKAAPKVRAQRRNDYRYVDTSCHSYGGYGWGPYFGPCPYRGEVYAAQPGPPVFGPFMPFGPFW